MSAIYRLSRSLISHRLIYLSVVRGAEICLFLLAGLSAFLLRFEFTIPHDRKLDLAYALAVWVPIQALTYYSLRLWSGAWKFVSLHDALRLLWANFAATVISALIIFGVDPRFPRSLYILDFMLCYLLSVGVRAAFRMAIEVSNLRAGSSHRQRTFIYGAGAAGVMVLRESRSNGNLGYHICGFIDDNPVKAGFIIQGTRVLGSGRDLAQLAAKHDVQHVLIAIPSASGSQMRTILGFCADAKLRFKTIPALSEIIHGRGLATQIRDVAVEDLLGRTAARLDEGLIRGKVEGEVVLVTGAAGSIGSELCRQIARFNPARIIGLEMAETALFHLQQEMKELFPEVHLEPVIGNIKDRGRLRELFELHRPTVVFHAAAYKHVPMMETHLFEAVENNILGTYNVAALAGEYGVREFVMISSDKAVRPTSIMGVTKRVAEMLVASLEVGTTKYVSVRFGNVLGSNGSVVPIFRRQIEAGGPITVTHPEMRRYFMTIPEAAQLVMQAYAMGKGGEIFVLDMGKPIRIVDLATQLILLSGLRPGEDIKIEFSGVRPGEKLYEELNTHDEEMVPTYHEKIHIFTGNGSRMPNVASQIEEIRRLCETRSRSLVLTLKELVADYNPSSQVLQTAIEQPAAARTPNSQNGHGRLIESSSAATLGY
ncbi:MAG: polysaccharide biosynthesis protein [Acidobacteriaceae bacterium]|nr:polysaccharide biosynthesis protein [Acidobacteriaceae bacterium]MBV9782139.1 polysaccharide biosynthesis protein [Acidobacteriaceae bacterium]